MAARILIDDRLETAQFSYPIRAGWIDTADFGLVAGLTPSRARDATVALLDSIAALTLLGTHVILRDVAVASRRASMLTLTTHTRPDEVEQVTVGIRGISPAGRALATAVLHAFYGIAVASWSEEPVKIDHAHAAISEDAAALIADEDEERYQEDLGRAWFLLTQTPFVSHVAIAPRALLASDPSAVRAALERLQAAREAGLARARELRRDLAKDHDIDRELLTEVLADQTHSLDTGELNGLAELAHRSGLGITTKQLQAAAVRVVRDVGT